MDREVIRFHHGPFFKGLLSSVGFGLLIIGTILFIFMLNERAWSEAVLCAVVVALGLELARGVRGVEVDLRKREVFSYSKIYAFKYGPRVPLDDFDTLALKRVREKNLSNNFNASTANGLGGAIGHMTNIRFELELRDNQTRRALYLEEFKAPGEAQATLHQLADRLGLPAVDEYKSQVDALQKRRASADPRSRRRR